MIRPFALSALIVLSACVPASPSVPGPAPAPSPRQALRTVVDSIVAEPAFRTAQWGVLIVDPERGDTLYSHNAGKLFMPASNQKILTGAVALAQLGPDYRYRTVFAARGTLRDSVLDGDLLVFGRGDPSFSDRMRGDAMDAMREMADSLAARGVKRIAGSLVSAANTFTDEPYGDGWPWDEFDYYYSAPVEELLYNESSTTYHLIGGARAGDSVRVRWQPDAPYPPTRFELATEGEATDTATHFRIQVVYDSLTKGYTLRGPVRAGDSVTIDVAHHDPIAGFMAALREGLRQKGITVGGARRDTAARVDTLFAYLSPPMREILPALEKRSQNQIGELLVKTLGLEKTGTGTADSGLAVMRRQLLEWGVERDGVIAADGSGLSRYNYLTPTTVVRVLDRMRRHPDFTVFLDALPIAGVDGTIRNRMKGTPAEGNARAKTGYVSQARSLSGYVTTADGRQLIFSLLCNNFYVPVREVERAQDAIVVTLAGLRLDGPAAASAAGR